VSLGVNLDWSRIEVEAVVADYLQMLTLELSGQSFNKTEHRRRLLLLLDNRTEAAIERKHGNISAVMLKMGIPRIRGYKPWSNAQTLLNVVVEEQVRNRPSLDQAALAAVQQPAVVPSANDFARVIVHAPTLENRLSESTPVNAFNAIKRDYLARETENRSLGLAGEEFVIQYEHWRLVMLGQRSLADRVEHVANTRGDGLGYDVLSFVPNGQEKFIEVKTTAFGKETPFFVSRNELDFSKLERERFHLYRLFEFRKAPRLFDLPGRLDTHCMLDPITYRASFS
jgi:Domain of unknown function (DUF3883)